MSGILPMKVIKVGTSSQSRIAQACDRCRSKKIRCDGVRPCCSQCASVGFECKTSDKLSRRAFPRGYTESLEERVRSLEAEVRELRELLGEKSEKIDNLSSIRASSRASNSPASPTPSAEACAESPLEEGVFHVQTSSLLLGSESSHSLFVSDSSGRAFVGEYTILALVTRGRADILKIKMPLSARFRRAANRVPTLIPKPFLICKHRHRSARRSLL